MANKSVRTIVEEQAEAPESTVEETAEETPVHVFEATEEVIASAQGDITIRAEVGDSYLSIAERYGVNVRKLAADNENTPVRTGTRIIIKR